VRRPLIFRLATLIVGGSTAAAAQQAPAPPPYYELYPEHLPYETGEPIPAGYVVEKNSTRVWGILTGSIVLGVFYTYGLLSVKGGSKGTEWLLLPVVGPTGLLVTRKNHCSPRCYGIEQGSLIIDAVGQTAAAAVLTWGLASWRVRLVREDLTKPQALVTPMLVGSGYGVGALGSF
jgi:hypothetical protein